MYQKKKKEEYESVQKVQHLVIRKPERDLRKKETKRGEETLK